MSEIDNHLDTIMQSMTENYPENPVDEVEFSVWGRPNKDTSPWNIGISNFRSFLMTMTNSLKLDIPEPSFMLTVQVDNTNRRLRITDMDSIQMFCKTNTLPIDDKKLLFEDKDKLSRIDTGYGLRLRYSTEKSIKDKADKTRLMEQFANSSVTKLYRYAKRYSMKYPLTVGNSGSIRLDFTVLRQGTGRDFRAAKLVGSTANKTAETYEIEVELIGLTKAELEDTDVQKHIKAVLKPLLLEINGGICVIKEEQKIERLKKYAALCREVFPQLPNVEEIKYYNQYILKELAPYYIAVYIATIDRTVLLSKKMLNSYMYTDKADGLRALMHVAADGTCSLVVKENVNMLKYSRDHRTNKQILVYDKQTSTAIKLIPTDIVLNKFTKNKTVVADGKKLQQQDVFDFSNSIFDGELLQINGSYHFKIFDILVHNSKSVMSIDFKDRLELFKLVEQRNENSNFYISPKTFGKYEGNLSKFSEYVQSLIIDSTGREVTSIKIKDKGVTYELDGLVFQPESGEASYYPEPNGKSPRTWLDVYKWKPQHHLTIDLKLDTKDSKPNVITRREKTIKNMETVETEHRYAQYKAYSGNSKGELFLSEYPCNVLLPLENSIPRAENGEPIVKGNIVECRLSVTDGYNWVPVRIRHDKSKPNSLKVYESTLYSITEEPITLDNLRSTDGGFGGHSKLVVTKLNRTASNEHVSKWGLKIKGDIVLLDLASGNAKSASAWRDISRSGDKNVAVLGIDAEDVQKAYSIMNADFNKDKKNNTMYVKDFDFVVGDFLKPLHFNKNLSHLKTVERFNMVSCIFAMHYAMRSENDFRMFLANVTRNLKNGGVFIGSYMNKRKILDLFNAIRSSSNHHVKQDKDNRYIYTETNDGGKDIIWKIQKEFNGDPELFSNNAITVDFLGLYKGHLEYLIDLEDARILDIIKEYGLELKEHISFNEVITKLQKDGNNYIKDKYKEATPEELLWMDLHYNFTFSKTSSLPAYVDLFQIDKPKTTVKAPVKITVKATVKDKPPAVKATVTIAPTPKVKINRNSAVAKLPAKTAPKPIKLVKPKPGQK